MSRTIDKITLQDDVTATVEAVAAQQDRQIFDHLLRAGTTAGQRWNWTGVRAGQPLAEIETLWTVGHFFSLASFTRAASMQEHVRSANVATAMQVLNAVPANCEAPTGFVTMASLPLIYNQRAFRQPKNITP